MIIIYVQQLIFICLGDKVCWNALTACREGKECVIVGGEIDGRD